MKQQEMSLRKSICLGILIVLSLLASGCTISSSEPMGAGGRRNAGFPSALPPSMPLACASGGDGQGPFVGEQGTHFTYGGKPLSLYGYAFYPSLIGGASAWHMPDFTRYIDHILDMGAQAGQNLVRPTDFWGTPYRDRKPT